MISAILKGVAKLLIKILANSAAIYIASLYVAGFTFSGDIAMLFVAGALLTLGSLIHPVLQLISLPLSILSFGLTRLVIDFLATSVILWGIDVLMQSLTVDGFMPLFSAAFVVSLIATTASMILNFIF